MSRTDERSAQLEGGRRAIEREREKRETQRKQRSERVCVERREATAVAVVPRGRDGDEVASLV